MIKSIRRLFIFAFPLLVAGAGVPAAKSSPAAVQAQKSVPAKPPESASTASQDGISLLKQLKANNAALWKTQKALTELTARTDASSARLQDSLARLSASVSRTARVQDSLFLQIARAMSVDSISKISLQRMQSIEKTTRRFFAALTAVILVLFLLVALLMRRVRQAQPLPDMIHSEVQFFFNKLKGILNRQATGFNSEIDDTRVMTPEIKETDHTLPIRVAEEVFRMRTRLMRMPADTKGLAALSNAVKRLEDDLNVKGYFIVDLAGQPYVDEMTLAVREFVPRDDLPTGSKKILRMIRPQIKFKNVIISQGEVEVAMSADDLAQK